MLHASGFVPARFLILVAHFVLLVVLLIDRDENIKACLPLDFAAEDYDRKDAELAAGLAVALALIFVELAGFLSGVSMFSPSVALLSMAAHASASVALAYFCLDVWDCNLYWWVFSLCSVLPALAELMLTLAILFR
jgi:hypothetical protein